MVARSANQIRIGNKVELDNLPFEVVKSDFIKPGRGGAYVRMKIRNMKTSQLLDRTFRSEERIIIAEVYEQSLTFLYRSGDEITFMNERTFDQITTSTTIMREQQWLIEGEVYLITFYKGKVFSIAPPTTVLIRVVSTPDGDRGDSVGRATKEALLSNGVTLQVPLFIKEGELIRVDTRSAFYISRG